jgi:hypothetical protein
MAAGIGGTAHSTPLVATPGTGSSVILHAFGASSFTGPQTFTQVTLNSLSAAATGAAGTSLVIPQVTIRLSVIPSSMTSAATTTRTVYVGALPLNFGANGSFASELSLQSSFDYDPGLGDLMAEIRVPDYLGVAGLLGFQLSGAAKPPSPEPPAAPSAVSAQATPAPAASQALAASAIPEPASLMLLGAGLLGLAGIRRRYSAIRM